MLVGSLCLAAIVLVFTFFYWRASDETEMVACVDGELTAVNCRFVSDGDSDLLKLTNCVVTSETNIAVQEMVDSELRCVAARQLP